MNYHQITAQIPRWAEELGFDQVGITDPDLSQYVPEYREWLAQRFYGDMGYMNRNVEKRTQPQVLVPGTVRVISVRINYLPSSASNNLSDRSKGYISRYALGRDYHKTVRHRLAKLANRIAEAGKGNFRAFVDSAPVLEKPIAEKAGLGWIGKHTLIINENAGSWFFLGEIYTDMPLPVSASKAVNQCGKCKACINICPTNAIIGPRRLDARKCISYLTIEHKGSIDPLLREAIGNRIFGCDDCQLICPWNRYATYTQDLDFLPRHSLDDRTLVELLTWEEHDFLQRTEGMAIRRISYAQWTRNLAVAAGNAKYDPDLVTAVARKRIEFLRCRNFMCVEHLDWALNRLELSA